MLGEDEFRQLTQKGNGKQRNMKGKYRSVDDETIVEKTYLNSNDEDFPLEKQLDKWKGMDKDHVLRAFKEYVTMNRWVKDFLRNGSPFPNNLTLQDVLKYLKRIKGKYRFSFIEMGLIGYNVKPQTTPHFLSVGAGPDNNINRNFMGTNTGQSPTPSIDPYGDDDDDNDHFPHKSKHYYTPSSSLSSISLEEIIEYNEDVAKKGGKDFIEEDDLDGLNLLKLRSGKPYKTKSFLSPLSKKQKKTWKSIPALENLS